MQRKTAEGFKMSRKLFIFVKTSLVSLFLPTSCKLRCYPLPLRGRDEKRISNILSQNFRDLYTIIINTAIILPVHLQWLKLRIKQHIRMTVTCLHPRQTTTCPCSHPPRFHSLLPHVALGNRGRTLEWGG